MKTIKTKTTMVSALLFLAVCISLGWYVGQHLALGQSIPSYTIRMHTMATGAAATGVIEYDVLYGQKSNGDVVTVRHQETATGKTFPYPNAEFRQVRFAVDGSGFEANNYNSNVVLWGKKQPIEHDNMGDCRTYLGPTLAGETKTILGFTAVRGVQHTEVWDEEVWLAPALDCVTIEKTVNWKKNNSNVDAGAPDGITTERAIFLSASAPDDSLFSLPRNAVEVSPSEYRTSIGLPEDKARDARWTTQKAAPGSGK